VPANLYNKILKNTKKNGMKFMADVICFIWKSNNYFYLL